MGDTVYDDCCLDELSDVDSYRGSLSDDRVEVDEGRDLDEEEELII